MVGLVHFNCTTGSIWRQSHLPQGRQAACRRSEGVNCYLIKHSLVREDRGFSEWIISTRIGGGTVFFIRSTRARFRISNGDGVGDIRGIIQRLPYLQSLGVDAIWLSPIFPSPMADFGYDISDYTGIDPLFGAMDDFDALVDAAHASGLKVILDLVPNHTSDQHPWFIESRRSRDNPKRDWYIWRDPASRTAARRTTGYRNSAAVPGNMTRRRGSIITTPSCRSSPT